MNRERNSSIILQSRYSSIILQSRYSSIILQSRYSSIILQSRWEKSISTICNIDRGKGDAVDTGLYDTYM